MHYDIIVFPKSCSHIPLKRNLYQTIPALPYTLGLQRYACLTVQCVSQYRPYDTIRIMILGKTAEEKTNEWCHLF
jgi:hypothetical protein